MPLPQKSLVKMPSIAGRRAARRGGSRSPTRRRARTHPAGSGRSTGSSPRPAAQRPRPATPPPSHCASPDRVCPAPAPKHRPLKKRTHAVPAKFAAALSPRVLRPRGCEGSRANGEGIAAQGYSESRIKGNRGPACWVVMLNSSRPPSILYPPE
uniref:Uncharacterized protein n=1 Tax=Rousettus aegyptiacus TaxID=9407 RepID=A0A7J8JH51_ROUAE|nr:hypothetical protein HJG63_010287 [Rousettus aegyptiacus]